MLTSKTFLYSRNKFVNCINPIMPKVVRLGVWIKMCS